MARWNNQLTEVTPDNHYNINIVCPYNHDSTLEVIKENTSKGYVSYLLEFKDLEYEQDSSKIWNTGLWMLMSNTKTCSSPLFNQVSNPDEVRKEDAEPQACGHQMQKSQTTKIQRIGL